MTEKEHFLAFTLDARNEFVKRFLETKPTTEERVMAEDLLIAYDQVVERYRRCPYGEWKKFPEQPVIGRLLLVWNANKDTYQIGRRMTLWNWWKTRRDVIMGQRFPITDGTHWIYFPEPPAK